MYQHRLRPTQEPYHISMVLEIIIIKFIKVILNYKHHDYRKYACLHNGRKNVLIKHVNVSFGPFSLIQSHNYGELTQMPTVRYNNKLAQQESGAALSKTST